MNEILPVLQANIEKDQVAWQQYLTEQQIKRRLSEEERKEKERRDRMAEHVRELRCFNCSKFICLSSDIRRINGYANVVVEEDVHSRIMKMAGNFFCSCCQVRLGTLFDNKGVEFPLIVIRNLKVVDQSNGGVRCFKRWRNVNFNVEDCSLEQLQEIVDRRNEANMSETQ